jgi:hypothetical protein
MQTAGKIPRATVSKIREILHANPGMTLRGSIGPDGQSQYELVPSGHSKPSRQRQLAVLRARADVATLDIAEAREARKRQLARLKARVARSCRLLGV